MATFVINEYEDIHTHGFPTAGTWEVAEDPEFNTIIDRTEEDSDNILSWSSMLPKSTGDGYHGELENIYVRVKLHIDNTVSEWFYLEPKNQKEYEVKITHPDGSVLTLDSLEMGIH